MSEFSTLPPLDRASLPASLRDAGPERRREFQAALGFERQLVTELAKTLSRSAMGDDEQASAATRTYRDMLPSTLADAVAAGGGLGLAAELDRALHPEAR